MQASAIYPSGFDFKDNRYWCVFASSVFTWKFIVDSKDKRSSSSLFQSTHILYLLTFAAVPTSQNQPEVAAFVKVS